MGLLTAVTGHDIKVYGPRGERDWSAALRESILPKLDTSDCEQLARRMRYQSATVNQILMQTGDEADKFYIVLRGQLQARRPPHPPRPPLRSPCHAHREAT